MNLTSIRLHSQGEGGIGKDGTLCTEACASLCLAHRVGVPGEGLSMAADIKAYAARRRVANGKTKACREGEMDLTSHYRSKKKDVGSLKRSRALRKAYMAAVLAAKRLGRSIENIPDPSKDEANVSPFIFPWE